MGLSIWAFLLFLNESNVLDDDVSDYNGSQKFRGQFQLPFSEIKQLIMDI